jgi:hypothetical protein
MRTASSARSPIRSVPQRDGEIPSRGVQRLKCSAASTASPPRSPSPAAQTVERQIGTKRRSPSIDVVSGADDIP